jgi:hypothetical protein
MAKESTTYDEILEGLKLSGWLAFPYFCFGNWYLPVNGQTYDEYFTTLSSRVKSTIHRKQRKFFREGRGKLELVTDGNNIDNVIAFYTQIYNRSWKVPEPFPDFVPCLIRLCANKGWLRMGLAYFDGMPIAAQIWIVAHSRASIYKLAYDEAFKSLSAGSLLTDFLMRHVIDVDKVKEIDYLIGDDSYKKDWMTHRRERWGVLAFDPSTVKGAVGAIGQYLLKGAKYFRNILS